MTKDDLIEIATRGINFAKRNRGVAVKRWSVAGEDEKERTRIDAKQVIENLIALGVIDMERVNELPTPVQR